MGAVLVTSLKKLDEAVWREFFESVSMAHRVLARDPAGAYAGMDFDSRSRYRAELADLAKHGACSEIETAQAAISLCEQTRAASDGSRAAVRRTHVGFYLVDQGRAQLEAAISYRPPVRARIPRLILRHPTEFLFNRDRAGHSRHCIRRSYISHGIRHSGGLCAGLLLVASAGDPGRHGFRPQPDYFSLVPPRASSETGFLRRNSR